VLLKKYYSDQPCAVSRESVFPQLETAIHAVDVGEALTYKIGCGALAGIAVIADTTTAVCRGRQRMKSAIE
jgi:hypothetical protein